MISISQSGFQARISRVLRSLTSRHSPWCVNAQDAAVLFPTTDPSPPDAGWPLAVAPSVQGAGLSRNPSDKGRFLRTSDVSCYGCFVRLQHTAVN